MTTAAKYIIRTTGINSITLEEVEPGYLLGTIEILGTSFHVEAILVADNDETGVQQGIDEDEEGSNYERIERLFQFADVNAARFQTVEIEGREFVLAITPFCD